jgi:hypothetical protein
MWWVAVAGVLLPNITVGASSYAAFGVGGHFMVILPELQIIIVHRYDTDTEDWEITAPSPHDQGTLVQKLLAAYRPTNK